MRDGRPALHLSFLPSRRPLSRTPTAKSVGRSVLQRTHYLMSRYIPYVTAAARPEKTVGRSATLRAARDKGRRLGKNVRCRPHTVSVRSMRPENGGGRPGFGTPIAISHRIGVVICPLAGRKGNGVSYKLLQTRKSQKQRLQHNSASRAALSPLEWDARLLACGAAGRATSADPMVHGNDRSVG